VQSSLDVVVTGSDALMGVDAASSSKSGRQVMADLVPLRRRISFLRYTTEFTPPADRKWHAPTSTSIA